MSFKLIMCLLLFSFTSLAQNIDKAYIDSLRSTIPNIFNDTVKARALNKIAIFYKDANPDTALKYTNIGMQLVEKMKWDKGIAVFYTSYGNIYSTKGQLDSAIDDHLKALEIFKKLKDTVNQAISFNNLGGIAKGKSDFVAATQYFSNTLRLGQILQNNYLIGLASENLALVYQFQEDYSTGINYARQAITAYKLNGNEDMMAAPLDLMGTFFLRLKKYDSAYYYYQKALFLCRKFGNIIKEAGLLDSFADYYASLQDYNNAIKYGKEAKKIWDVTGPAFEDAINNTGMIGYYYLQLAKQTQQNNYDLSGQIPQEKQNLLKLAGAYLIDAIAKCKEKSNKTSQLEFLNSLSEVDALSGNYKEAYINFKSYQEIKDSVFSQDNKNKIAAAISRAELDKKNAEIALNNLTISNQRKQKILFLGGLFLLSVIGMLLYWQSHTRKKTNATLKKLNSELEKANIVKAKFFGILSHDLRSPVANLINLLHLQKRNPGILTAAQKSDSENKITDSAEKLLESMETMLLWSKGQMEHFKPTISTIEVKNLFAYLKQFFSHIEHIDFVFFCEEDLALQSDENYLQTIMQNLTANAIKALHQTKDAQIIWKAWQQKDSILISITDNGMGTTNEQLRALYDDTVISGTKNGLGLHIIRDLAKAIGCIVTLEPHLKTGTSFVLRISRNHLA